MPSTILGVLAQQIISGNPWSGIAPAIGGVQLRWDLTASGQVCYIGFSGNMTFNSGGMFLSGSLGLNDGMPLAAGDAMWVPKSKLQPGILSGEYPIFASVEASISGSFRLYWERF